MSMDEFDGFVVADTLSNAGRILHVRYGAADGAPREVFWPCPPNRVAEYQLTGGVPLAVRVVAEGDQVVDVHEKCLTTKNLLEGGTR